MFLSCRFWHSMRAATASAMGRGFYDRTLAKLRAARDVLAVGFAFAGQEFETVPHDENDQRLDWVVTENGARKFQR